MRNQYRIKEELGNLPLNLQRSRAADIESALFPIIYIRSECIQVALALLHSESMYFVLYRMLLLRSQGLGGVKMCYC